MRVPSFNPDLLVVLGPERDGTDESSTHAPPMRRRIVRFDDADFVYLVAPDGKTLAHIDDEVTFMSNGFDWKNIETLPASRRVDYVIIDDADREAKRRAGLILFDGKRQTGTPIQVLVDEPGETRLQVKNDVPGYLVLDRTNFPGWRATVNGVETPVLRANYAFMALPLPAGDLDVRIWYRPESLTRGAWIGLLCLLVGVGSLFRFRARRAV
jgi:hypothetical protein